MRSYVGALAATLRGGLPAAAFQLKVAAGLTGRLSEQRPLTWAGDCAMLLQDSAGAEELYSRAVDRSRELANIADLMHALHLRARCELDLGKVAVAEADAAEAPAPRTGPERADRERQRRCGGVGRACRQYARHAGPYPANPLFCRGRSITGGHATR
jgi:hypothetical protein